MRALSNRIEDLHVDVPLCSGKWIDSDDDNKRIHEACSSFAFWWYPNDPYAYCDTHLPEHDREHELYWPRDQWLKKVAEKIALLKSDNDVHHQPEQASADEYRARITKIQETLGDYDDVVWLLDRLAVMDHTICWGVDCVHQAKACQMAVEADQIRADAIAAVTAMRSTPGSDHGVMSAFDIVCEDRDEWKRRATLAEAEIKLKEAIK